jgi:SAM-dependent methyltransferase
MTDFDHRAFSRRAYDARAAAYLASAVHAEGEDLAELAATVAAWGGPKRLALDLGCGGGHVAYRLAAVVEAVLACDLAPQMLATVAAEARRRQHDNIAVLCAAAEALPWPAATFDLVASRFSVHHWRDRAAGLQQAARVLKPGGLALFIDTLAPPCALLDTWLQSIELLRDASHVRNATLAEWVRDLGEAGLAIRRLHTGRLPLDFAAWVARTRTPPERVAAIVALQAEAGREVRRHFSFLPDGSFSLDTVFIEAARCA